MAVKSFRRRCRIRNLLKYSSFAARDETKPPPLCWGTGWFRHFGAAGPVLVKCWSCAGPVLVLCSLWGLRLFGRGESQGGILSLLALLQVRNRRLRTDVFLSLPPHRA